MTAAQRQIETAAERAKVKGLVITGYRPAVGLPKHPDGSSILVVEMAQPKVWERMVAMATETRHPRGLASEQGVLL